MIATPETRPAAVVRPLAAEHARAIVAAIKERVHEIRELVLELHEREGWRSLGYSSWRECVTGEFEGSKTHLYRQLQAALIEREIIPFSENDADPEFSPMGEKPGAIPERQLRPLAELPEGHRKEAWEEARATAPDGKVTAKHVQATVDRRLGKSVVNGREMPDPPDVAKKRAEGRIEPDAVVEVVEPEAGPEPEATEPEPAEDDLDDDAWLDTLPLRPKLSGASLKWFDLDALLYRTLEPVRATFLHHAVRALGVARRRGGNGEYAYRISTFLKLDHPRHWKVCPPPEDGGCGGTGTVGVIGQCPRCRGRGYWIL